MSLLNNIRGALGMTPKLRNKAGGMAWINAGVDGGCGERALINRVVRTVRVKGDALWEIDPPQPYLVERDTRFVSNGHVAKAGQQVIAISIKDECLTPIQGDISDEEVSDLYLPSPTKEVA